MENENAEMKISTNDTQTNDTFNELYDIPPNLMNISQKSFEKNLEIMSCEINDFDCLLRIHSDFNSKFESNLKENCFFKEKKLKSK